MPHMNLARFKILLLLIFVALLIGFAFKDTQTVKKEFKEPKHIVLITIDSLRADHMGTYGYDKKTTPFLDSLFKKGVTFDKAITPGFLTFQTDSAIFSSLYPSQNNVMTFSTPINKNLPILPQILNIYGYKTAAFVSPSAGPQFGWSDKFQTYKWNQNLKNIKSAKLDVASWLNSNNEPSFLFWHIYDVHIPFVKPSKEFYKNTYSGPFSNQDMWKQSWQTKNTFFTKKDSDDPNKFTPIAMSQTDVEYIKSSYDTGVSYVDEELRLFFNSIKDKPFFNDTLFIITSEHGEDLKEHGYIFHGDIYNVNIHAPLTFIYPSLKPQRIQETVSSLDILPTLLELLGIPQLERAEGISLVPYFSGKSVNPNRSVFTERPPFDEYALHKGKWKYILRNSNKLKTIIPENKADLLFSNILKSDNTFTDELYNIDKDPYEQHNLIGMGIEEEQILREEIISFREKMRNERRADEDIPSVDPEKLIPYP